MTDPFQRPTGSNADEWAAFLSENCSADSIGFLAVQIAEAIEENVKRTLDATVTAVVYTVGGTVEGHPTSSINYLQRLRELVAIEAALTSRSTIIANSPDETKRT